MANSTSGLAGIYERIILGRPWLTLLVVLLLTVFFGYNAQHYKVDASADSLVLEGDQDLEFFREVGKRYAAEEYLVIAYQPASDLFSDTGLDTLAALVDGLGQLDRVSSVMSVLDVPLLYSPKVSIADLGGTIATLRDDGVDRRLAKREFEASPIYRQLLTNADASTTAIQVNIERDTRYSELLDARDSLRLAASEGTLDTAQREQLRTAEAEFKAYATMAAERQRVLVAQVREVLDEHRASANAIYLGGVPMIASDMVAFVKSDLQNFGAGILVFIVLLLSVIFRAPRWVVLPLLACLLTNVFMLGLLGALDWRMTVISSNFVALLLIITLAIGVHLVVRYRELQLQMPDADQRQLAMESVRLMAQPCLYTGLTTIVAFMSLVVSGIRPVIDFGWMMTVGVVVALLTTFTVVPLGMLLGKAPAAEVQRSGEQGAFTLRFAALTDNYRTLVLLVAGAVLLFSVLGLDRLKVENRFIDYFDESTEIYQGMELIDAQLGGTIPLEIVLQAPAATDLAGVDAGAEFADDEFADDFSDDDFADDDFSDDDFAADDFADDEFADAGSAARPASISRWFTLAGLDELDRIHRHVEGLEETGKVLSLATLYEVARDLLGSGLDDIQLALAYRNLPPGITEVMVDPYLHAASDEARVLVRVKETSRTLNRAELLAQLDTFMREDMGYSEDRYRFTGMLVLYNNMLQSLFASQILTLGMVFIAITIMLVVLFRSLALALIGIVPNLMAALLVLGGMGWAGIPLDMMTITIAAISIGIGVDNTIHYVHRFKREFPRDRDYRATMYRCHGSIGRAMYYTSVTIIFGFSILTLSNFTPSIYFGLLTGVAMFAALLGSLVLLPRLLLLFRPLGPDQGGQAAGS